MDFRSQELNSAEYTPSSITHTPSISVDVEALRNELRIFILTKDKNLLNLYDIASLNKVVAYSGIENLSELLSVLNNYLTTKFKEDQQKSLTIRKIFDIMNTSLKTLQINNIDCNSNEINTLILGFLIKNFI
jgi:hypothetical protein